MTVFVLGPLLLVAYRLLCLLAPEKHLAFNAWLNRRGRRKWHEQRAYTTPHLRIQRRWNQQTPANLWRLRLTESRSSGVPCGSFGSTGESIAEPLLRDFEQMGIFQQLSSLRRSSLSGPLSGHGNKIDVNTIFLSSALLLSIWLMA